MKPQGINSPFLSLSLSPSLSSSIHSLSPLSTNTSSALIRTLHRGTAAVGCWYWLCGCQWLLWGPGLVGEPVRREGDTGRSSQPTFESSSSRTLAGIPLTNLGVWISLRGPQLQQLLFKTDSVEMRASDVWIKGRQRVCVGFAWFWSGMPLVTLYERERELCLVVLIFMRHQECFFLCVQPTDVNWHVFHKLSN